MFMILVTSELSEHESDSSIDNEISRPVKRLAPFKDKKQKNPPIDGAKTPTPGGANLFLGTETTPTPKEGRLTFPTEENIPAPSSTPMPPVIPASQAVQVTTGGATDVNKGGGVMHNGGVVKYNKGPEYAVPMRDMKITTIPSKRAMLCSAESEEGQDAQGPNDRRDSIYDEGNVSYDGAGYSTIEEYGGNRDGGYEQKASCSSEVPADVQELLNGLQGPSSPQRSSHTVGTSDRGHDLPYDDQSYAHVAPRGQSCAAEKLPPPQHGQTKNVKDMAQSYSQKMGADHRARPQMVTMATQGDEAIVVESRDPSSNGYILHGMQTTNVNMATQAKPPTPGITLSTQTFPEPQEAKVEFITIRNVYDSGYKQSQGNKRENATHPGHGSLTTKTNVPPVASNPALPTKTRISESNTSAIVTRPSASSLAPISHLHPSNAQNQAQYPGTIENSVPMAAKTAVPMPTRENIPVVTPDGVTIVMDEALEVEDEIDSENIQNVEEQIMHAQQHLQFLHQQQEKLKKRKEDRTKLRETIKRNSSAFENYSGYPLPATATLPRQPSKNADVKMKGSMTLQHVNKRNQMPPVTNVDQGGAAVQQNQSHDPWVTHDRSLGRQISDTSHNRTNVIMPTKSNAVTAQPRSENNNIIMASQPKMQNSNDNFMTSDLQEQLAELDRCIAQLTTSMDPSDVPDSSPAPPVVMRHRPAAQEPQPAPTEVQNIPVPQPPARNRSSFESYKRLSQEFDTAIKRRSISDAADGNDDVFSPPPQQAKLAKSPFPPQTSVTRRQHGAPAPPPKRRMSLEERLSPALLHTLQLNPGAKPKEDIHSYKEDLNPDRTPETPSFPITPTTPYVNNTSPVHTRSPPGLMQTPLSILHLKPTETPTEVLHHHKKEEDGPPGNKENMQNGHVKETALLSDGGAGRNGRLEARNNASNQDTQLHADGHQQHLNVSNGNNNHLSYQDHLSPHQAMHGNIIPGQRDFAMEQQIHARAAPLFTSTPQQLPPSPNSAIPPQYHHNHSGASHSSHSPAATSSNSCHGSSDSLDGPSTRHSNSSLLSSSSSASSPHPGIPVASPNSIMRPGSQMSSYDRNFISFQGTRSGDESLSPQSGRTSSSSISDVDRMNNEMSQASVSAAPKFIRDTTAYWYKPDITRDQALALLRDKPAGCFVVRDSRCFPGAFGLALKVDKLPPNVQAKPGVDLTNELVRHFLIEPSSRGVKLKGCQNEPVFGSLSALVYQHSITQLALPCKLIIPTSDLEVTSAPSSARNSQHEVAANSAADLLRQGAACNVVYIGSVDTESLTGSQAIDRAIRGTFNTARTDSSKTSVVHFKVSPQGITLTDVARKLFFRRHYPTSTVTYCGLDPIGNQTKGVKQRRWDATNLKGSPDAWMFGFVARKNPGSSDNMCHVFAELDSTQPARAIVNFVTKVLIGTARQNS